MQVGIDVLVHTSATMKAALGVRMAGGNDAWLRQFVERKLLGRKTGSGFYLYDTSKGSKSSSKEKRINPEATAIIAPFLKPHSTPISDKEIVERMVFRFMKECMHSLEDGVIKSAADGGAFRSACSSCDSASTNHTMRTLPFCVPRMCRYWCHLWAGFPSVSRRSLPLC